jgi:hypothetical protein
MRAERAESVKVAGHRKGLAVVSKNVVTIPGTTPKPPACSGNSIVSF